MDNSILSAPLVIHWWVTSRCNLNCPMCSTNSGAAGRSEMDTQQALMFVERLRKMRVFTLVIGGGEPFSRLDLPDILTASLEAGLRVHVTTNGTLLSGATIGQLAAIKFSYPVQVSIDGNEYYHDQIRGRGSYRMAVEGLVRLKQAGLKSQIACLVNPANFFAIDEVVELAARVGAGSVVLHGIIPVGRSSWIMMQQWELGSEQWRALEKRTRYLAKMHALEIVVDPCPSAPFVAANTFDQDWTGGCTAAHTELTVDACGNVYPCIMLSDRRHCAGNLLTEDVEKIWRRSAVLNRVRRATQLLPPACTGCGHRHSCFGGCRGLAYLNAASLFDRDPRCTLPAAGG